jgi:hypothetical protein
MPTPPEICTRLPIRAGADGGPGVDHGALIDIGAEIDEGGHQHDVFGDESRAADDGTRDGAKAGVAKPVLAPALEFRGHLVPPRGHAGTAGNRAHVVEAERQQHRLLQPLVDLPLAAGLALGDADLAPVEQLERVIHRVPDFALGRGGDTVAGIERGVDGGFEGGKRHRDFLGGFLGDFLGANFASQARGFVGIWGRRVKAHGPVAPAAFPLVVAGLDPAIHLLRKTLSWLMDARIKSGHGG